MMSKEDGKQVGCNDHNFTLTPISSSCYLTNKLSASFCQNPIPRSHINQCPVKKSKKNKWKCLNCPTVNHDKSYASPCFILTSQKNYYQQSFPRLIIQHQRNILEQLNNSIDQIYVPKPKSKTNYCSVCKTHYQEYLPHIQSSPHKIKIKNNQFNQYIIELQQAYVIEPNLPKNNSTTETKQSKAQLPANDQDEEINALPRKIVKTNQTLNFPTFSMPTIYTNYPFQYLVPQNNSNYQQFTPYMQYFYPYFLNYPQFTPYLQLPYIQQNKCIIPHQN